MHTDLLDQLEGSPKQEDNTAEWIENLESCFDNLRVQLTTELEEQLGSHKEVVNMLVFLPIKLRKEYEYLISLILPALRTETTTNGVMVHLSPFMSFMDYGLLAYLIRKFGSSHLKEHMRSYESDILMFMKETTIAQLTDCLPGQAEAPTKFYLLKIDEDPHKYTLKELDIIRRRYCPEMLLSEIVFHLIAKVESN